MSIVSFVDEVFGFHLAVGLFWFQMQIHMSSFVTRRVFLDLQSLNAVVRYVLEHAKLWVAID